MGRVVVIVPVWEVNVGGEVLGFDDQEPAGVKKLVESREFGLGMVEVFDDFAADDKIVGGAQSLGVRDENGIVGGHGISLFLEEFGNDRAGSCAVV